MSYRLLRRLPAPPAWLPGTALALTLIWNGSFSSIEDSIFVRFDGFWYLVFGEVIGLRFFVDMSRSVEDYWNIPSYKSAGSKFGMFLLAFDAIEYFICSANASTTY